MDFRSVSNPLSVSVVKAFHLIEVTFCHRRKIGAREAGVNHKVSSEPEEIGCLAKSIRGDVRHCLRDGKRQLRNECKADFHTKCSMRNFVPTAVILCGKLGWVLGALCRHRTSFAYSLLQRVANYQLPTFTAWCVKERGADLAAIRDVDTKVRFA